MSKLKFKIFQAYDSSGIKMSFTDGKGIESVTYFNSPPSTIDHVDIGYLQGRFGNVKTVRHEEFIKSEYKRLMSERLFLNEFEDDDQIKSLLINTIEVATPLQRIKMAQWLGLNVTNE